MVLSNSYRGFLKVFSSFSLDSGCFFTNFLSTPCTWPFSEAFYLLNHLILTYESIKKADNSRRWTSVVSKHSRQFSKDWILDCILGTGKKDEVFYLNEETKFEICGWNHCQHVRRRSWERYNSECLQTSVKLGGCSTVIWNCISAPGIGHIAKIDGLTKNIFMFYLYLL